MPEASRERERPEERAIAFTPLPEVERAIHRALSALDLDALAAQAVADATDRARGRV